MPLVVATVSPTGASVLLLLAAFLMMRLRYFGASSDSGSWRQCSLSCLDGPTVEQIGVEALCRNGAPRISAWWQAYPAPSQPLDLAVAPGHHITVGVSVGPAGVTFALRDHTSSASFRKTL